MRGASDCQPHALRSRGSPCKWVKSDVFHSGPMSALCQKHTFAIAGFRLPSATDADVVVSVSCQTTVCRREKTR